MVFGYRIAAVPIFAGEKTGTRNSEDGDDEMHERNRVNELVDPDRSDVVHGRRDGRRATGFDSFGQATCPDHAGCASFGTRSRPALVTRAQCGPVWLSLVTRFPLLYTEMGVTSAPSRPFPLLERWPPLGYDVESAWPWAANSEPLVGLSSCRGLVANGA